MSHYLSGALMLLLLIGVTVLGMEAYGVYNAARMVEASLLDAQLELARSGGVSQRTQQLVRERIAAEGGDVARLSIGGSRAHTPAGELVTLQVTYEYPYRLGLLSLLTPQGEAAVFRIRRQAVTTSGWEP